MSNATHFQCPPLFSSILIHSDHNIYSCATVWQSDARVPFSTRLTTFQLNRSTLCLLCAASHRGVLVPVAFWHVFAVRSILGIYAFFTHRHHFDVHRLASEIATSTDVAGFIIFAARCFPCCGSSRFRCPQKLDHINCLPRSICRMPRNNISGWFWMKRSFAVDTILFLSFSIVFAAHRLEKYELSVHTFTLYSRGHLNAFSVEAKKEYKAWVCYDTPTAWPAYATPDNKQTKSNLNSSHKNGLWSARSRSNEYTRMFVSRSLSRISFLHTADYYTLTIYAKRTYLAN